MTYNIHLVYNDIKYLSNELYLQYINIFYYTIIIYSKYIVKIR